MKDMEDDPPSLRIAVALGTSQMSAWAARVVQSLLEGGDWVLIGAIIGSAPAPSRSTVLERLYERIDEKIFRPRPDAVETGSLPLNVVVAPCRLDVVGDSTSLGPDVLRWLGAHHVDIVVGLDVPPIRPEPDGQAALWWLEIANQPCQGSNTSLFFGLVASRGAVPITLREVSPRGGYLRGGTRHFVTSVMPWSVALTRNRVLWSAAQLVTSAIQQVRDSQRISPSDDREQTREALNASKSPGADAPPRIARQIVRVAGHAITRAAMRDEWRVFYRRRVTDQSFMRGDGFRPIEAPAGHSYADPFVVEHQGRHHLFVEDYQYGKRRGRIICLEVTDDGVHGQPVTVLERPYHLSYPFVFQQSNDFFMVPESGSNRSVDLYRAVSFPERWEFVGGLLSGMAAFDTSIVEYGGLFWLFTTIARPGMSAWDELHLYWSDHLTGPWRAHRMNPVVMDVRAGRGAGRPFMGPDRLIRPAQNSEGRYGQAIHFQAIRALTMDDYDEVTVASLDGHEWGARTAHTFNFDDRYDVVDGIRPSLRRPAWSTLPGWRRVSVPPNSSGSE
jgi:hypothetical protein